MSKFFKLIKESTKEFTLLDWILFGVVAFACFFSFQHTDIAHTGSASIGYLNGHILSFYEYNQEKLGGCAYLPTTYIFFAIWNIPVRILGIIKETIPFTDVSVGLLLWFKLLPVSVFMASGVLFKKICTKIGLSPKNAKICVLVYFTNPIGFFSQFIFGQYDIFTLFFVLLGVYFFLEKKDLYFILSFSVALTMKYYALLIFVPLLLLRQKNVLKIIRSMFLVISLFFVETVIYIWSDAFRSGVFGFNSVNYVFNVSLNTGYAVVSIVPIVWIFICGMAYFKKPTDSLDEIKWGIYYCNLVTFVMFGLSMWHPQWLLMAVPFWVLGTVMSKNMKTFFWMDLMLMGAFVLFTVNVWKYQVDQYLISVGIWKGVFRDTINTNLTISDILIYKNLNLIFTAFTGLLLVYTFFKSPKYMVDNMSNISFEKSKSLFWARFILGVGIFVVPAVFCAFYNLNN